jgi:hypothetical protein
MAVTQDDLNRLNAAIAADERMVVIGGQTTMYYSKTDLISARNDIQRQLNAASAQATGKTPRRRTLLQYGGRDF